jgi:tetratricopeptide (TPR) repeat protein
VSRARSLGTLALALAFVGPVRSSLAQAIPRPRLAADADTADWRAYYAWGVQHVARQPLDAERAFAWANRLNPLAGEPLFGLYVAGWRQNKPLYRRARDGDETAWSSPVARHLDTLYARALERDPLVNQQLETLVEGMLVDEAETNTEWANDGMTQGLLAYQHGEYARAIQLFGEALPTRARLRARYQRALVFNAMGRYADAATELSAALGELQRVEGRALVSAAESKAVYGLALGNMYRKAGQLDQAREAYRTALSEDLSLANAHVALADLALGAGDVATATQEYAQALELEPGDGAMHARFGDALRSANDNAAAAAQYRRAIELEPDYFVPYLNLGIVLDRLQKRDEAAQAYMQFLARAPRAVAAQVAAVQKRLSSAPAGGQ